jgi:hypothetical protein
LVRRGTAVPEFQDRSIKPLSHPSERRSRLAFRCTAEKYRVHLLPIDYPMWSRLCMAARKATSTAAAASPCMHQVRIDIRRDRDGRMTAPLPDRLWMDVRSQHVRGATVPWSVKCHVPSLQENQTLRARDLLATQCYLQAGLVLAIRWQVISHPLKTDLAAHCEAHFCGS